MPPRVALQKPQSRNRHFVRQWREHRGLSQDQLAARLEMSKASLSRIETLKQPYTQDFLEAWAAAALNTDPASLLMRDPTAQEAIWSIWEKAAPGERKQIEDVARVLVTGRKSSKG
jgi:transcriptional regulator with XRE-family HTH domain